MIRSLAQLTAAMDETQNRSEGVRRKSHARRGARQELRSLLALREKTGEDIHALITIPPATRAQFEAFCEADPEAATPIRRAIDRRDYMLRLLAKEDACLNHS